VKLQAAPDLHHDPEHEPPCTEALSNGATALWVRLASVLAVMKCQQRVGVHSA
jgi:hypothetical protein